MSECRNPRCGRSIQDAVFCCEPCSSAFHRGNQLGHSDRCNEKAAAR